MITFTIVTHNNEATIEETVRSLVNCFSNEDQYLIYIVDNLSTDNTLSIIESIEGKIKIIRPNSNLGFGYGHNYILDELVSDYHVIVNPDISISDTSTISTLINFMDQNRDIGMCVPKILNTDGTIQYLNKRNPTVFDMGIRFISPNICKARQDKYVLKDRGYDSLYTIDYASGCFMFFRTSVFKSLNGFDTKFFMYLEDADITRRVNEISKAMYYPKASITHKWERASHKKLKYILITFKSMSIYFKKWGLKIL